VTFDNSVSALLIEAGGDIVAVEAPGTNGGDGIVLPGQFHRSLPQRLRQLRPMRLRAASISRRGRLMLNSKSTTPIPGAIEQLQRQLDEFRLSNVTQAVSRTLPRKLTVMRELKSGDLCIPGSDRYSDFREQFVSEEECLQNLASCGVRSGVLTRLRTSQPSEMGRTQQR
jgi:hypothetical protein